MSATLESTPVKPAEEDAGLTHEMFLHHMTAMKGHYKSANSNNGTGPTHAYALPVHLVVAARASAAAAPTDGAAQFKAAMQASKNSANAFAQDQKNAVSAATSKLQSNHDTSSFAAAMNAQRQQAKAESDKRIDTDFDSLIDVGTKHPEMQSTILDWTSKIGAFFTNLLSNLGSFLTDIYHKIMGWINSAVDWVKGAAAAVSQYLNGTVSAITSFFGGL